MAPGEDEREPLFRLAQAHPRRGDLCRQGLLGRAEYERTIELISGQLITPERHGRGECPPAEVANVTIRLVIESVFANLKRQMRRE